MPTLATSMKTVSTRSEDAVNDWVLIDAEDQTLGRLASLIAIRLRGKHKVDFTPHVDNGDYVVVINASKVKVTGKKETDKLYYRHTGYPGGIKNITLRRMRETKPERIIEKAVKGMLPRSALGRAIWKKLKVYGGSEHPHDSQQPRKIEL
ncbi:MAG: 50S ribosomal protein L13 [Gammaproteobacteria bacterium]|jgi:large subunit ribosomal protein L13|nr:MAG: 50S ribosomal protein L13 [Gammaproteobacteria bacterium]